jgi:hypothetical protein
MNERKLILRVGALQSLKWARRFRDMGDSEYFDKALENFRMWRAEAKAAA